MKKLSLYVFLVLMFFSINNLKAEHSTDHFVVIDCTMKGSYSSVLDKNKFGVEHNQIRISFNKDKTIFSVDAWQWGELPTIPIYEIDQNVKWVEEDYFDKFKDINKRLILTRQLFNFLDVLKSVEGKTVLINNLYVNSIVDKKSSNYWRGQDDESIYLFLNRIDGTGSLIYRKKTTPLLEEYFLNIEYPHGDSGFYAEIETYYLNGCQKSQQKF